jgi:hypothetical protein
MNIFLSLYRFLVRCLRHVYTPIYESPTVQMRDLPWLSVYGMTQFNEIKPVTDIINNSIIYGSKVDSVFLKNKTKLSNVVSWHYLDSDTLEDKEFPYEGIIIQDNDNSIYDTKQE